MILKFERLTVRQVKTVSDLCELLRLIAFFQLIIYEMMSPVL